MPERSVPRYEAHEVSVTRVGRLDANPACQVSIIVEGHFKVMRRGAQGIWLRYEYAFLGCCAHG